MWVGGFGRGQMGFVGELLCVFNDACVKIPGGLLLVEHISAGIPGTHAHSTGKDVSEHFIQNHVYFVSSFRWCFV